MTWDCPRTDAVLARFLDGDPAPDHLEALAAHEHLRACASCRTALRRARRLDAALAGLAETELAAPRAQRLLAAVEAVGTAPRRTRRRVRAAALVLLALLVASGGAAIVWKLRIRGPLGAAPSPHGGDLQQAAAPKPARTRPVEGVSLPDLEPGWRRTAGPSRLAVPPRVRAWAARTVLTRRTVGLECLALAVLRSPVGLPTAAATPAAISRAAARTLAGGADPATREVLVETLASAAPGAGLAMLLAATRGSAVARHWIERALTRHPADERILRVAARVGTPRLDALLRRIGAEGPESAEHVAAALATLPARPGRARLLVDIWSDLSARGFDRPPPAETAEGSSLPALEERAARWFSRLEPSDSRELIALARGTRSAERRDRCFAALAARGDREAVAFLIERVDRASSHEALAAAFALGRCPRAAPAVLQALGHGRRPHLLRAALASARPGLLRAHLPAALSARERALFERGRLTRDEVGRAALLLQRRRPRTE